MRSWAERYDDLSSWPSRMYVLLLRILQDCSTVRQLLSPHLRVLRWTSFLAWLLITFCRAWSLTMGAFSTVCLAVVTLCCWRLYNNWKQLNHVPGPLLTGLSDYWRAWHQRRGELRDKLVELHKQYGPIVRYGVRSVSVPDPSAIGVIYSDRAGYTIVSQSGSILLSTAQT